MAQGKKEEAEEVKAKVNADAERLKELEAKESELNARVKEIMMTIPNIIDPSVLSEKTTVKMLKLKSSVNRLCRNYENFHNHTDIMEKFNGIDLEAAGKVAGNGFYYLMGDIARLHSAVISMQGIS